MRDAVIVEAVRTPVGKRNGGLSGVHPVDLSAHVLEALAGRTGIDPAVVDDVIWGCVSQVGEQTFDIARSARARRGLAGDGPGRRRSTGSAGRRSSRCTSRRPGWSRGSTTWSSPAASSRCRGCRWAPRSAGADPFGPRFAARYDGARPNQGVGAEMIAERWGLSRAAARRVLASGSHEKAAAARAEGRFDGQIAPVTTADGGGERGRGHPPRLVGRVAGGPQDRVQAGRCDHGGQRVADLRRRGRAAHDHLGEGARAGAHPDRAGAHRGAGRRRPGDHADRADPGHPQGAGPQRAVDRRHRGVRGERGLRARAAGLAGRDWAPTRRPSTRTAGRSRSATRSARPGRG